MCGKAGGSALPSLTPLRWICTSYPRSDESCKPGYFARALSAGGARAASLWTVRQPTVRRHHLHCCAGRVRWRLVHRLLPQLPHPGLLLVRRIPRPPSPRPADACSAPTNRRPRPRRDLHSKGLTGTIPPELAQLSNTLTGYLCAAPSVAQPRAEGAATPARRCRTALKAFPAVVQVASRQQLERHATD